MSTANRIQKNALLALRTLCKASEDDPAALTSLISALGMAAAMLPAWRTADEAFAELTKKDNPPYQLFCESFDGFRAALAKVPRA